PVFHTIVSIKNDGHYFCRAGGNRPDGLNEPVTCKHTKITLISSTSAFTMSIRDKWHKKTRLWAGFV
ncbi:hypothetical protein ACP81W_22985, partial [Escherichia coli]